MSYAHRPHLRVQVHAEEEEKLEALVEQREVLAVVAVVAVVLVLVAVVVVEKLRVVVVVDQLQNAKAPQPCVHLRLRLHPSPGAAHESGVKGRAFALMLRGR